MGVAIVVAVARGIQVVMNDGNITATVLHWGEMGLSNLGSVVFIILAYVFYIPMSFLIPSTWALQLRLWESSDQWVSLRALIQAWL